MSDNSGLSDNEETEQLDSGDCSADEQYLEGVNWEDSDEYDSSEDTDYDVATEETQSLNETFVSTVTEGTVITEDEYVNMLRERGSPPKKIKRREDLTLTRPIEQVGTGGAKGRFTGGHTSIKKNLPKLCAVPEELGWSAKQVRRQRPCDFNPTENPGVIGIKKSDGPLIVFEKIVSGVMDKFLQYSNDKRREMKESGKKINEIDKKDVAAFLALNLWMDTKQLANVREYFCMDDDLNCKFCCRLREQSGFGRNKLTSLFNTIRMHNKAECDRLKKSDKKSENYDPQFRTREVVETFVNAAQGVMNPSRHLALDESMDLYTVRGLMCIVFLR